MLTTGTRASSQALFTEGYSSLPSTSLSLSPPQKNAQMSISPGNFFWTDMNSMCIRQATCTCTVLYIATGALRTLSGAVGDVCGRGIDPSGLQGTGVSRKIDELTGSFGLWLQGGSERVGNSNRLHLWGVLKVDALFGVLRPDLCGVQLFFGVRFSGFFGTRCLALHTSNTLTTLLQIC